VKPYPDLPFLQRVFNNADGSANVGYIVLFWMLAAAMLSTGVMVAAAVVQQVFDEHHVFPYLLLGQGMGLILSAFLPLFSGVAAFLWADSKNPPQMAPASTSTTTVTPDTTTVTSTNAGGIPPSTTQGP